MIELKEVTKTYNDVPAVDSLTATIKKGEVAGFLGPNGAGKTTTMRMLVGFLAPDRGQILLNGANIEDDPISSKRLLGYLPENNPLFMEMLVKEFLELACDLRNIPPSNKNSSIERAVSAAGIEKVFYRPINQLSKGYRQRTGLAQAILHQPEILILDEPTEGLDPNQRVDIRGLIKSLGKEHTVLLSTHVLQEIKGTCDRVLVIHKGKLVADGSIDALLASHQQKTVIASIEGPDVQGELESLEAVASVTLEKSKKPLRYRISVKGETELRPVIFRLAAEKGWVLWELFQEEAGLEEVFRSLTKEVPGK